MQFPSTELFEIVKIKLDLNINTVLYCSAYDILLIDYILASASECTSLFF